MLTKSLHTATAVASVARFRLSQTIINPAGASPEARTAAICDALAILGYDAATLAADDATVAACYSTLARMLRRG